MNILSSQNKNDDFRPDRVGVGQTFRFTNSKRLPLTDPTLQNVDHAAHAGCPTTYAQQIVTALIKY